MSYTVQEAIEELEEIADENPDAILKVDPPHYHVRDIMYRSKSNVVEIHH